MHDANLDGIMDLESNETWTYDINGELSSARHTITQGNHTNETYTQWDSGTGSPELEEHYYEANGTRLFGYVRTSCIP